MEDICIDCMVERITVDNYMMVCPNCGQFNMFISQSMRHNGEINLTKKNIYMRAKYLRSILDKILCRVTHTLTEVQIELLKFGYTKLQNIDVLKKLLKINGLSSQNHTIYSIYRDLTGVKLIELSSYEEAKITTMFQKIDREYKKMYQNNNFMAYNFILRKIGEHYDIDCLKYLPKLKLKRTLIKLEAKFDKLIATMD